LTSDRSAGKENNSQSSRAESKAKYKNLLRTMLGPEDAENSSSVDGAMNTISEELSKRIGKEEPKTKAELGKFFGALSEAMSEFIDVNSLGESEVEKLKEKLLSVVNTPKPKPAPLSENTDQPQHS